MNPTTEQHAALMDPRRKSPLVAILLSVLPGLGQVYVGYYPIGITLAVTAGVLMTLVQRMSMFGIRQFGPLLVIGVMFTWLFSAVDAGRRASLYNQALAGLRPMDLPENQKTPTWRGSVAGGLALVVIGGVLFAHTMFDVPLEWLTRWWPMALVLVGLWLLAASVRARAAERQAPPQTPPDAGEFGA